MSSRLFFIKILSAICCFVLIVCESIFSQSLNPDPPLTVAMHHLGNAQAYSIKNSYPRSTNPDGTIKRVSASDWTSGFFPGSLWLMYEYTKDTSWLTRATQWTAGLEGQKNNTSTHDLGFILYSSFGGGYRLTQSDIFRTIILQGAKSLSTRYNPVVGCIKSWDNNPKYTFPVIIDNMMNLEMLFFATKMSGDSSYYRIAVRHALTTIANHFRPDNSSYHVVDYNPSTGAIISKTTAQGLNNLSDWARGQAWGLYGFTMCYRETGDARFLDMATKVADFYISHPNMPPDHVPFWDFDAVDYRDASAAAISAAALLELSEYVPVSRTKYYNFGLSILVTLSSMGYAATPGTNNDFILKHGVGNKPANTEVDKPLVYADYYYIQALLRHKKPAPMVTAISGINQVILQWNKATGASSYTVKRSLQTGGPYTAIDSNITTTAYQNTGLKDGMTYYYVVASCNAMGEGESSAEVKSTPGGLITNVVSTSGRNYTVATLSVGTTYYTDRTYQVTSVPGFLSQSILLKTANDDKTNRGSTLVSFDLTHDAALYIAYDPRGTVLPAWMSGWQKLPYQVGVNDSKITKMDLYKKDYSAGTITLGGNLASPAAGALTGYFVIGKDSVQPALISNISATSGRTYALADLVVGALLYTDRVYPATSLPSFLNNAAFIKPPNDDKTNKSASLLSFDLSQPATVYILYDPRATSIPLWMSTWTKVAGQIVGFNDSKITYLDIYSRSFATPGRITLGGNLASPAAGSQDNYIVAAVAQQSLVSQSLSIENSGNDLIEETAKKIPFVRIYANPVKGKEFFVNAKGFLPREFITITIFDVSGKTLQSTTINADEIGNVNKYILVKNSLIKGVFIIRISAPSHSFAQKIIIE